MASRKYGGSRTLGSASRRDLSENPYDEMSDDDVLMALAEQEALTANPYLDEETAAPPAAPPPPPPPDEEWVDELAEQPLSSKTGTWASPDTVKRSAPPAAPPAAPARPTAPGDIIDVVRSKMQPGDAAVKLRRSAPAPEAAAPTYHDTAERIETRGPEAGARPNQLGYEDEIGFKRDERIRRAGEAYDKHRGPPESHRWEDEFRANHRRPSDDDISRNRIVDMLFSNKYTAAGREAEKHYLGIQGQYDEGLERARDRDMKGDSTRRVSRGLAEAIAASGMVDPDAAAQLAVNDPVVQAFQNGGYAQGMRAEDSNMRYHRENLDRDERILKLESQNKTRLEEAEIRAATGRYQADAYRKTPKTADYDAGAVYVRNELRDKFAGRERPVEFGDVRKYMETGDPNDLPEDLREGDVAQIARVSALNMGQSEVGKRSLTPGPKGIEGKIATREKLPYAPGVVKEQNVRADIALSAKRAMRSWLSMPKKAQDAFAQFGRNAPSALKNMGLGEYQAAASDVISTMNTLQRAIAGLAVTDSEMVNVANENGLTPETYDPFRDPGVVRHALERTYKIFNGARKRQKHLEGDN